MSLVVLTFGLKSCLLSVIVLIYCVITENFTHLPTNPVSVNLIQHPPPSSPIPGTGAISACVDTTCRVLNMWEDTEFIYILCVCSISDSERWGSFPSLDNVSTGFIILRADTRSIVSFFSQQQKWHACRNPRSNCTCGVTRITWDLCFALAGVACFSFNGQTAFCMQRSTKTDF